MGWTGRDGKSMGFESCDVGIKEWWNDGPIFHSSNIPVFQCFTE
jgi:hypothetical protein